MGFARFLIFLLIVLPINLVEINLNAQNADAYFSDIAYNQWRSDDENRRKEIKDFERFLRKNKVDKIFPTHEILRSASMAKECGESGFEVAPHQYWQNMINTLRFIKDEIMPVIGPLEAVSTYRNPKLNECAGGAKNSAHAQYFALDMYPKSPISREELIQKICLIHSKYGEEYGIGLGFYNGTRFHIDSKSFRRWGPDGRSKTSPCAEYDKFVSPLDQNEAIIE
jgi:Peptidase M15